MSTHRIVAAAVLVLMVALAISLKGCGFGSATDTGSSDSRGRSKKDGHEQALPPPKPLLDGWPTPAAALILSGEQHGYLEPCGCSETQSGGLSRRADLLRQIEQRQWPVTALDLGGTVKRVRTQSKYKFETILAALKDIRYTAIALGPEELRFGPDYLTSQHIPNPNQPAESLTFLGANVDFYNLPDFEYGPARSKTVTLGGVTVGVTAVLGSSLHEQIFPKGSNTQITLRDPNEALRGALTDLKNRWFVLPGMIPGVPVLIEQKPDLLILLSHGNLKEARGFATQFPEIDLIVSAGGPEDPDGWPEMIGDTMLVTVGRKGKYVGVGGYYPDDADRRLRFELVDLDNRRFANTKIMRAHMRHYQDRLQSENIAARGLPIAHPSGAAFVGAEKCGECHKKAFAKWSSTKHAQAFTSLVRGRKGQEKDWISRIYDAECLSCHVTGWEPQEVLRFESGFVSAEETPHLVGQQCENCHSPGSRHVEFENLWKRDRDKVALKDLKAERRSMQVSLEFARQKLCFECHDLDNSPHFEFDKFWKEVEHRGRD